MHPITITRKSAGYYHVTRGDRTVEVIKQNFFDGPGWIAIATWTQHLVTDPQRTKREAQEFAAKMLNS